MLNVKLESKERGILYSGLNFLVSDNKNPKRGRSNFLMPLGRKDNL